MNNSNIDLNVLWNSISPPIRKALFDKATLITTRYGDVLYDMNAIQHHVYFPLKGIVSIISTLEDGSNTELAIVGVDGVIGASLILGANKTINYAMVQTEGSALQVKASAFREYFERDRDFRQLFLCYTQAFVSQIAQNAVCYRHHSLDQQLSRWLLLCFDRSQGETLHMTQETIALMIGVRREGVTMAAVRLQERGLISYSRGVIRLLDRPGLQSNACECYRIVESEYERLVPFRRPSPN